uniref:Conotoxin ArMKLT2-0321 n=1 Tax=Conus arenatus TaxID=89451 RepID=O1611_CONAE|nr:RecName: Full=Conotoxin ArMKLT2-0321; Flags: Precursor [Conus arenatus]AAG60481.1 conotoxin scaffold VI/VII precursor [Conus arenatus]
MKLTCVLIIAMLFLIVCQLNTADDSTDKQEYRAVKLRDAMRNFKGSKRNCGEQGEGCATRPCCAGLSCVGSRPGGLCQYD